MLEQSALHGQVFCSEIVGKSLISKPAELSSIQFGPMRPISIHRISDNEMWVQDTHRGDWYHYTKNHGDLELALENKYPKTALQVEGYGKQTGHFYYYGKALYATKNQTEQRPCSYFVQNKPRISYDGIPDIEKMELPLTLQALDYDRVFQYPKEIKSLLANAPASYVDRFKRPVKQAYGRTYPIAMEKVTTTWKDLPETTYPVVVNFEKTPYAVADLEPDHTEDDFSHFNALPGYYEEDTPRGGKHKVIRVESKRFKFRYSPGLEILNQSLATLYGINGKWLSDNPDPIDTAPYHTVGHESHEIVALLSRPDVSKEVAILKQKAEENLSTAATIAAKMHQMDPDVSHGDWMALYTLYHQDIKPYKDQLPLEKLPWILESYALDIIPYRDKHEEMRVGVPYLVFLADKIITGKR